MPGIKLLNGLVVEALLVCAICAYGAESSSVPGKPMKMDKPMPTKMAKPGMKQGDVKKAAAKKEREMKPMLDKEAAGGKKK